MIKNYLLLFFLIISPLFSYATHVRAGEITATRVEGTQLTYRIVLVTYTDEIGGKNANDAQEYVDFNISFSSDRAEKLRVFRKGNRTLINRATVRNVYDTTYTFPASGFYTIGASIVNRNANTVNLPIAGGSENVSFYVQTSILINANIGFNSTPVLLNIPIDSAAVGQRFIHNPGAFDIDGDSLSYRITQPRKDDIDIGNSTTTGRGIFIPEYIPPNEIGDPPIQNQAGTGLATFGIDPITGDLIWDAPQLAGQYNVAFVIEEWRKGLDGRYVKIGEIVRDMQIIVVETDNIAPVLTVPDDICVEAGETIEFEVYAEDENEEQRMILSSSGGVYNIDGGGNPVNYIPEEAATFTSTPASGKVVGKFVWKTNFDHAREQAYSVVFKVEDEPGRFNTQLVDIKTINIRVLPSSPKALVAEETDAGNQLTWRPFDLEEREGKILVYRKAGCSGLNPGFCSTGMPDEWGYTLIGTADLNDSTFIDTQSESEGAYSYRLVTEIAENNFITLQSAPSIEFCLGKDVKPGTSLITKVSVNETFFTDGSIEVRWTRPVGTDLESLQGPFSYKLYRAEGLAGENFELIQTLTTDFSNPADTVYIDQGLNTEEQIYKYKVEFLTDGDRVNGTSHPAASVYLSTTTGESNVPLSWNTNTPWSNDNTDHYIFREDRSEAGKFNLIKKLSVGNSSTYNYVDTGEDFESEDGDDSIEIINGETYCYVVMTRGTYENYLEYGVLENYSQVQCSTPMDHSPPCTPALYTGKEINCEQMQSGDFCHEENFVNDLRWTTPDGSACLDGDSYEIYFARYETDTPVLIATTPDNSFQHFRNSREGFAGCYTIRSKNSMGLYSEMSNKICFDNCEKLTFPNVFSPNGDGKNDTFTPMNCPAFVKGASMSIYNAHGQRVLQTESDKVEWDGLDDHGKPMPSGTYYYNITVHFERLAPEGSHKDYKGYVTLIR